jgi:hypothetical protein
MLEIDDDCKVRDKDPVHLSGDGYTVIAAALKEKVAVMAVGINKRKAVGNVGHSAPAAKRQRPLTRGGFVQQTESGDARWRNGGRGRGRARPCGRWNLG